MPQAAPNESELWAGWLSGSLLVGALWGRHGDVTTPASPHTHAPIPPIAALAKAGKEGKAAV